MRGMVPVKRLRRPACSTTLFPSPQVGKVSTPSSAASAASRSWVGPIHWAPTSTTFPPPMSWFSTRPPTRSRASTTTTEAPAAATSRAADSPARPAPTTTTSVSRSSGPGIRADLTSLCCDGNGFASAHA